MYSSNTPWVITRRAQSLLGLRQTGVWDGATSAAFAAAPRGVKQAINTDFATANLSEYSVRRVTTQVTEPPTRPGDSAPAPRPRPVTPPRKPAGSRKIIKGHTDPSVASRKAVSRPANTLGSNPSPASVKAFLQKELASRGYSENSINAIFRQITKESGFNWRAVEDHRYFTKRPKMAAFSKMSQLQIADLARQGPEVFFEAAYGPHTAKGKELGNTSPGDGQKFRGRGLLQETGRSNYARLSRIVGVDLVSRPEKLNSTPAESIASVLGTIEHRFGRQKQNLTYAQVLANINPGLVRG